METRAERSKNQKKALAKAATESDIIKNMTPEDVQRAQAIIYYILNQVDSSTLEGNTLLESHPQILAIAESLISKIQVGASYQENLRREEEQRKNAQLAQDNERRRRRLHARRHFLGMTSTALITAVATTGAFFVHDQTIGTSAQERLANERKIQAEIELAKRRAFEITNQLGANSSAISFSGWSIRHPRKDAGVEYISTGTTTNPIETGIPLKLPGDTLDVLDDTGFILSDYLRSADNLAVCKIGIATKYDTSFTDISKRYVITEERILLQEPRNDIHTDIVIFEKYASRRSVAALVSRSLTREGQKPTYQLRVVEAVKKS